MQSSALFCFVFHQYDSQYKEEFPVEDWKLFLVLLQLILTRLTELQYLFYLANRLNTYTRQLGKVSKHPWERAIFGGWGLRLRLRWGLRLRFPLKERNKDTKKEQLKIETSANSDCLYHMNNKVVLCFRIFQ